jgi:hypothetical protein
LQQLISSRIDLICAPSSRHSILSHLQIAPYLLPGCLAGASPGQQVQSTIILPPDSVPSHLNIIISVISLAVTRPKQYRSIGNHPRLPHRSSSSTNLIRYWLLLRISVSMFTKIGNRM